MPCRKTYPEARAFRLPDGRPECGFRTARTGAVRAFFSIMFFYAD